jgi:hypothetical protein
MAGRQGIGRLRLGSALESRIQIKALLAAGITAGITAAIAGRKLMAGQAGLQI